MSRTSDIGARLLCATAVGIIVAGISIYVAWHSLGTVHVRYKQRATVFRFDQMDIAIKLYAQTNGSPPRYLSELELETFGSDLIDAWDRPFLYSVSGSNYLIESLGRDGKRGGIGLDSDFSNINPLPAEATPPFSQFIRELPTEGLLRGCLIAGFASAFLVLYVMRGRTFARAKIIGTIVRILVVAIGALIVALIITPLHVPSGH